MNEEAGSVPYGAAYAAVMADVRAIPADRREVPGVWSLKDLMGHLPFWDQQQAVELRAIAAGQPFVPEAEDEDGAINAREAATRASQSWNAILAEVERTYADLRPLLDDPGEASAQFQIHDHWVEHGAQIRAWREANRD